MLLKIMAVIDPGIREAVVRLTGAEWYRASSLDEVREMARGHEACVIVICLALVGGVGGLLRAVQDAAVRFAPGCVPVVVGRNLPDLLIKQGQQVGGYAILDMDRPGHRKDLPRVLRGAELLAQRWASAIVQ